MQITRKNPAGLIENKLPDGSRLLVDSTNERVIALNATAGAAWDACGAPTTVAGVTEAMQRSLGSEVSNEVVEEAIVQLQEKNLIVSATPLFAASSRRAFITRLGAAAVPLVVAMTMSEQRAYAGTTGSGVSDGRNNGPGNNLWPGNNGPGNNNNDGNHGCGDTLFDQDCGKLGSGPKGGVGGIGGFGNGW